jgi:hypothetical protein
LNYIKYGLYLMVIVIIAILFEKIMIFLYNVTLRSIAGDIAAYILILAVWIFLYILARGYLDKKVARRSSQYTLLGGALHLGICLAIYFYNTEPLLLLIFPVLFFVAYKMRNGQTGGIGGTFKLAPTHPELIDDRGGICILRVGASGVRALKFFTIVSQIPARELLLYIFHKQLECTFEIHSTNGTTQYYLTLIHEGRNYDTVHQQSLQDAEEFRQFLKKENITFIDVEDVLNALRIYYAPYFLYTPSPLDSNGHPLEFPQLAKKDYEILIEHEYDELTLTIHALHPEFTSNELYSLLKTTADDYYLQFHLRPLNALEIANLQQRLNHEYCDSLKRLTDNLEGNTEFQAAQYLFTSVNQVSKENLEPLLDQDELQHLRTVKKKLQYLKACKDIGLWELELSLIGNTVLAETIAIKLSGRQKHLPPQTFSPIARRQLVGHSHIINSTELFPLLPHRASDSEPHTLAQATIHPTLEEDAL